MKDKRELHKREAHHKRESTENSSVADDVSPLEKHIRYFGGVSDVSDVSYSSMVAQNDKLGLTWLDSRRTAATVAFGGAIKVTGCPFSHFQPRKAVGVLNHPQSTGIFNLDGSLNEERWNELAQYADVNDLGDSVITEPQFNKFLAYCRQRETRSDPLGIARQSSDGEWAKYMEIFSEKNAAGVRFVYTKSLRDFFEDSAKVGLEAEERITKSM